MTAATLIAELRPLSGALSRGDARAAADAMVACRERIAAEPAIGARHDGVHFCIKLLCEREDFADLHDAIMDFIGGLDIREKALATARLMLLNRSLQTTDANHLFARLAEQHYDSAAKAVLAALPHCDPDQLRSAMGGAPLAWGPTDAAQLAWFITYTSPGQTRDLASDLLRVALYDMAPYQLCRYHEHVGRILQNPHPLQLAPIGISSSSALSDYHFGRFLATLHAIGYGIGQPAFLFANQLSASLVAERAATERQSECDRQLLSYACANASKRMPGAGNPLKCWHEVAGSVALDSRIVTDFVRLNPSAAATVVTIWPGHLVDVVNASQEAAQVAIDRMCEQ